MMMAVSFERYGRLYYLDPGEYSPGIGDKVLVPTDSGPEVAQCVWAPQWVSDEIEGLPVCAGPAGAEDLARDEENRRRRAQARLAAQRLIRQHELPMKLTAVDYLSADNSFIVYFSAPQRVDFRALVRDLSGRLKGRVELRQIGPRDEARLQGGIGPCGRDLCCATFLKDFEPVSVRMAKDQDLPVNPLRIAGACGRLMCCLKYEHPLYQEFRKEAPKVGAAVTTPMGAGTVVGHNVPADSVVIKLAADGTSCACPKASVCGSRQAYEAFHHGPQQLLQTFQNSYVDRPGRNIRASPRTERGQKSLQGARRAHCFGLEREWSRR
jgi:cell fate regulator YaaT (PSP1 superfamily)